MKKSVKKLWVKALRSGEYKQTKGVLHDVSGGFCCLGVLCNEYQKYAKKNHKKRLKIGVKDLFGDRKCTKYNGKVYKLPKTVKDWAGLRHDDPSLKLSDNPDDVSAASIVNDEYEWNFKQIADSIEKSL